MLPPPKWANRITGYGEEAPDQLLANDRNWRIHSRVQQEALSGVLNRVGIVQNVLVNQRSGKMVDGHLRAMMAISEEQPTIPVTYVDLSDEEEALILATLDPLSAMAGKDEEILASLVGDIELTGVTALDMLIQPRADGARGDEQERMFQPKTATCTKCGHVFEVAA